MRRRTSFSVGRYRVRDAAAPVGEGQFFTVFRGEDSDSTTAPSQAVAVKVARALRGHPRQSALDHADGEVFALRRVGRHPGVVRLLDVLHERGVPQAALPPGSAAGETTHTVVVTQLLERGELYHLIEAGGALPAGVVRRLVRLLFEALAHAHGRGCAHRDVKPEQVLLNERHEPVLADWGFAVAGCGRPGEAALPRHDPVGTRSYMAPEVASASAAAAGYDPFAADVWSAGVTAYLALCGFPPWRVARARSCQHYSRWHAGTESFWRVADAAGVRVSPAARAFFRRVLCPSAAERPTAAQALDDEWLRRPDDDPAGAADEYARVMAERHAKAVAAGLTAPVPVPPKAADEGGSPPSSAAVPAEDKEN